MKGFVGNHPRLKFVLSLREHFCVPQVSKAAKFASPAAFPGTGGHATVRNHNCTGFAERGWGFPAPVSAPGQPRSTDWAPGTRGCCLAPGQECSDLCKGCTVVPPLSAALPLLLPWKAINATMPIQLIHGKRLMNLRNLIFLWKHSCHLHDYKNHNVSCRLCSMPCNKGWPRGQICCHGVEASTAGQADTLPANPGGFLPKPGGDPAQRPQRKQVGASCQCCCCFSYTPLIRINNWLPNTFWSMDTNGTKTTELRWWFAFRFELWCHM